MKTVQMTLDNELVEQLDRVIKEAKTNRSAFTRDALRQAIRHFQQKKQLQQHKAGYKQQPVSQDEFSVWEEEQAWGNE